jgi:hypothetical protein
MTYCTRTYLACYDLDFRQVEGGENLGNLRVCVHSFFDAVHSVHYDHVLVNYI